MKEQLLEDWFEDANSVMHESEVELERQVKFLEEQDSSNMQAKSKLQLLEMLDVLKKINKKTNIIKTVFCDSKEELMEALKQIEKPLEKRYENDLFEIRKHFGEHQLVFIALREKVCTQVQVGTQKVMKPAPDAMMIEVEEPIYEWKCDSLLDENT